MPEPIFYQPGIGLAFFADDRVVFCPSDLVQARQNAAQISQFASGQIDNVDSKLADFHRQWMSDCANTTPVLHRRLDVKEALRSAASDSSATFAFDKIVLSEIPNTCRAWRAEKNIDWAGVETSLEAYNYRVCRRSFSTANTIVRERITDLPVFEVLDNHGNVVAEGKGLDAQAAKNSAMAECIERHIALSTKPTVVTASRFELEQNGQLVAQITAGDNDLFSSMLVTDWVIGVEPIANSCIWVPAELAYFDYLPRLGVRGFSLSTTTGLAAGSSATEAGAQALLEVIERDAYWIVQRVRPRLPDVTCQTPWQTSIKRELMASGVNLHLKDISLDWPVNVVLALAEGYDCKIPAFAHGLGCSFEPIIATNRAICEAIQVHSGLAKICEEHWWSILHEFEFQLDGRLRNSNPLARHSLSHLLTNHADQRSNSKVANPLEMIQHLNDNGMSVYFVHLGEICGLNVVRAIVDGVVRPDPIVDGSSSRLSSWCTEQGVNVPYDTPIAT